MDMQKTLEISRKNDPAVAAARKLLAIKIRSQRNEARQQIEVTPPKSSAFTRGADQPSLDLAEKAVTELRIHIARRQGEPPPNVVKFLAEEDGGRNIVPQTLKVLNAETWSESRTASLKKQEAAQQ